MMRSGRPLGFFPSGRPLASCFDSHDRQRSFAGFALVLHGLFVTREACRSPGVFVLLAAVRRASIRPVRAAPCAFAVGKC